MASSYNPKFRTVLSIPLFGGDKLRDSPQFLWGQNWDYDPDFHWSRFTHGRFQAQGPFAWGRKTCVFHIYISDQCRILFRVVPHNLQHVCQKMGFLWQRTVHRHTCLQRYLGVPGLLPTRSPGNVSEEPIAKYGKISWLAKGGWIHLSMEPSKNRKERPAHVLWPWWAVGAESMLAARAHGLASQGHSRCHQKECFGMDSTELEIHTVCAICGKGWQESPLVHMHGYALMVKPLEVV